MRLDTTALGPCIRFIMVADIGQQKARLGFVDYESNVAAGPDGPKMRVAGSLDTVVLAAFCSWAAKRPMAAVNVAAIRNSIVAAIARPGLRCNGGDSWLAEDRQLAGGLSRGGHCLRANIDRLRVVQDVPAPSGVGNEVRSHAS
jgi:hypothetical protein